MPSKLDSPEYQYPRDIVLKDSLLMAMIFAGGIVVGAAIFSVLMTQVAGFTGWIAQVMVGFAALLALGGIVYLYSVYSGKNHLKLSVSGLTESRIIRSKSWNWHDISDFVVLERKTEDGIAKSVRFNNARKSGAISDLGKRFSKGNDGLRSNYSWSAEDLAELLTRYQASATGNRQNL